MITAKRCSRADYLGFSWFLMYRDGQPIVEQGVHVKIKAESTAHAMRIQSQLDEARKRMEGT